MSRCLRHSNALKKKKESFRRGYWERMLVGEPDQGLSLTSKLYHVFGQMESHSVARLEYSGTISAHSNLHLLGSILLPQPPKPSIISGAAPAITWKGGSPALYHKTQRLAFWGEIKAPMPKLRPASGHAGDPSGHSYQIRSFQEHATTPALTWGEGRDKAFPCSPGWSQIPGLKFDWPSSASQSAGITGVSHGAWQDRFLIK
ncbi:hypothetical protein AAY473_006528 [Plecturocebus cupreus]